MLAPAYLELQLILDSLALSWDWPFTRILCSMEVSDRCSDLPSILNRISFHDPFFIRDTQGNSLPLRLLPEDEFFTTISHDDVRGFPTRASIQKANGLLFVDPIPDQTYTVIVHLQPWQIPLAEITSLPWFPWSEYLVSALAVKLCLDQDDNRVQAEAQLAAKLFKEIRSSISDQGERTAQVKLDPRVYRTPIRI